MVIYKITNKINNKSYIGQTIKTLNNRWSSHIRERTNTYFHNAIKKYGVDNFTLETLCECKTPEILNIMETFYIIIHKSHRSQNGYNLTWGGEDNPMNHKDARKKVQLANIGKKHSEESKKRMSNAKIGKISNWKGKTPSNETKQKMSNAKKGKQHSICHNTKISESIKKHWEIRKTYVREC
jgi:group I intron endonuclease